MSQLNTKIQLLAAIPDQSKEYRGCPIVTTLSIINALLTAIKTSHVKYCKWVHTAYSSFSFQVWQVLSSAQEYNVC
jgi:hypothetical protein